MMINILKFIGGARNEGTLDVFHNKYCYWFAFILNHRFPGGSIVYNPTFKHFAYMIDGYIYDIRGLIPISEINGFVNWDDYAKSADSVQSILDECILKLS